MGWWVAFGVGRRQHHPLPSAPTFREAGAASELLAGRNWCWRCCFHVESTGAPPPPLCGNLSFPAPLPPSPFARVAETLSLPSRPPRLSRLCATVGWWGAVGPDGQTLEPFALSSGTHRDVIVLPVAMFASIWYAKKLGRRLVQNSRKAKMLKDNKVGLK